MAFGDDMDAWEATGKHKVGLQERPEKTGKWGLSAGELKLLVISGALCPLCALRAHHRVAAQGYGLCVAVIATFTNAHHAIKFVIPCSAAMLVQHTAVGCSDTHSCISVRRLALASLKHQKQ